MIDVDGRLRIAPQQVLLSIQNELSLSSRYEVVRQLRARSVSFEGRNESVALANHRLDELRAFRVVAERSPDFADGGVDGGIVVDEDVGTPERRLNLSPVYKDTGLLDEEDQDLHRNLFELDPLTRAPQHVRRHVEFELAKTEAARHD